MMNYSIILLGATISVSLFIRICGAIAIHSSGVPDPSSWEAQLDDAAYGWLIGDPLYLLKQEFRRTLRADATYDGRQQELEDMVEQLVKHLRNPPKTRNSLGKSISKIEYDDDFYYAQICGDRHPHRNESHHPDDVNKVIIDGSIPDGCFFSETNTTKTLHCNDSSLTEVPPLPVELTTLEFSLTQIKKINRTDFGDVTIKNIEFVHNQINFIVPWAFEKVKGLTTLEILDNLVEFIAFEIYVGLTELRTLHLDGNLISFEIYENCSLRDVDQIPKVLPMLNIFSLSRNPLRIIPAQMWAGLRESPVRFLDLSSCSLQYIDSESFTFLPQLNVLYLTDNPELMPSLVTALEGLRGNGLETLSLGKNRLTGFPTEALSIIADSLLSLELTHNKLEYLSPESIPTNLRRLRNLNLNNCRIRVIQPGTLERMPALLNLDLSHNHLKQLPTMSTLTKVVYLNIASNNIDSGDSGNIDPTFIIPDNAFMNQSSLSVIIMSDVPLKRIKKNTFTGLNKLTKLVVDNNKLESIDDEAFKDLGNLTTLQMRNNPKLKTINSQTFYGLEKLIWLHMDQCGIEFPPPPSEEEETTITPNSTRYLKPSEFLHEYNPFVYLPKLFEIELSNNKIKYLYPQLFRNNLNLFQLNFGGNEIASWDTPLLNLNHSQVRKEPDDKDTGIRYSMFIVSNNKLSSVTDALIQDIISFQPDAIDLLKNPFMCDKGACKLRDLMNSSSLLSRHTNWISKDEYECLDPFQSTNQSYHFIIHITNKTCDEFGKSVHPNQTNKPDNIFSSSSPPVVLIIIGACVSIILIAGLVVGYKKRADIRYLLFAVKLNFGGTPRKTKTSVMELIQYDYDIFISYHNQDRDFIQDKFLPEVEEVSNSKNNSEISGEQKTQMRDVESVQTESKGFRVCIHERDFEAGMPITENIVEAVDRSKKVVIVVSKKYLESQWCTFEMNLAYHRLIESRRKAFVVILLEEIPSGLRTKVLNFLMRSRTYLEWPGDNAPPQEVRRFWSRLRSSLLAGE